jgi:hypothetical protein
MASKREGLGSASAMHDLVLGFAIKAGKWYSSAIAPQPTTPIRTLSVFFMQSLFVENSV